MSRPARAGAGRVRLSPRARMLLTGAALAALAALAVWLPAGSRTVARATAVRPGGNGGSVAAPPRTFGWPLRPFHREHALRATFGEPRAVIGLGLPLRGAARAEALNRMDQVAVAGRRSLHTGVDIVAGDGTPVYAVTSGVASTSGRGYERHVAVGAFRYWHLANAVPTGTPVVAFRTVIGTVYPGQHHLHLTRLGTDGAPINPLVDGGLAPYSDSSPPTLQRLEAYGPDGARLPLRALSGAVALAVGGFDRQSDGGLETGLYRMRWGLHRIGGGGLDLPPIQVFRFDRLPPSAVGQRLYTIGSTRHRTHPHFWYRLTTHPPGRSALLRDDLLQTRLLRPGEYELVVTAWDARGNRVRRAYLLRVVATGPPATTPAPLRLARPGVAVLPGMP
jgi:hypothetical protein